MTFDQHILETVAWILSKHSFLTKVMFSSVKIGVLAKVLIEFPVI